MRGSILYITPNSPEDRSCGGGVRSGFMLDALKQMGEVTTIVSTKSALRFPLKWWMLLPVMPFRRVYDWFFYDRETILQSMGLEGRHFDCVVVRYLGPMNRVAAWKIAPCYVDVDDLPSQKFKTLGKGNAVVRYLRCALMHLWERLLIRYATKYWVCDRDQMHLRKGMDGTFLPNIAKSPDASYQVAHVGHDVLLSVGGMSYEPNYRGVDWFVTEAWPRIRNGHPDMTYRIVGGGLSEDLRAKWSKVPGVEVVGFAEDLEKEYENTALVIAPIFSGSGTCIKVIEAALHGRSVLAAPFAARGLDTRECQDMGVTVCPGADAFCAVVDAWLKLADQQKADLQNGFARNAAEVFSADRFNHAVQETIGCRQT